MNTTKTLSVNRSELKYELPLLDYINLQNELDKLLIRDNYSKNGGYSVRSLYFDSLNDIDYATKYAGYERRKKLRIRIYNTGSLSGKFEIKEKNGSFSQKRSLIISKEEILSAQQCDYSFLLKNPHPVASELYTILSLGCYQPKAIIDYQRIAYIYPENNTRITLDSQIRCSELDLDLFNDNIPWIPVMDQEVILEVKFNGQLVKVISDILKKYMLSQVAISKYVVGRPIFSSYIF